MPPKHRPARWAAVARRAALDHGGRTIALPRHGNSAAWEFRVLGSRDGEIRSHIGQKRNYLGACLCDAAIAIEGGDGTASEAAFCIALGKPIVFVGPWVNYLQQGIIQRESFAGAVARRVLGTKNPDAPFEPALRRAYEQLLAGSAAPGFLRHVNDQALPEKEIIGLIDSAGSLLKCPDVDLQNNIYAESYRTALSKLQRWLGEMR